jgi:hypothetical protein
MSRITTVIIHQSRQPIVRAQRRGQRRVPRRGVNARLTEDFDTDLLNSREIMLKAWRRRPLWEKLIGAVAWILERQQ